MSALIKEGEERVPAEEAVEIIDCGRASERTKGGYMLIFIEPANAPFNWFLWG